MTDAEVIGVNGSERLDSIHVQSESLPEILIFKRIIGYLSSDFLLSLGLLRIGVWRLIKTQSW
jgi:hypothetical protein